MQNAFFEYCTDSNLAFGGENSALGICPISKTHLTFPQPSVTIHHGDAKWKQHTILKLVRSIMMI